MSLEKLNALDAHVRKLIQEVIVLRQENGKLREELQRARDSQVREEERAIAWEEERTQIRSRIERVLEELEVADSRNGTLEEAMTCDQTH